MQFMFLVVDIPENKDLRVTGLILKLVANEAANISKVQIFEKLQLFLEALIEIFSYAQEIQKKPKQN